MSNDRYYRNKGVNPFDPEKHFNSEEGEVDLMTEWNNRKGSKRQSNIKKYKGVIQAEPNPDEEYLKGLQHLADEVKIATYELIHAGIEKLYSIQKSKEGQLFLPLQIVLNRKKSNAIHIRYVIVGLEAIKFIFGNYKDGIFSKVYYDPESKLPESVKIPILKSELCYDDLKKYEQSGHAYYFSIGQNTKVVTTFEEKTQPEYDLDKEFAEWEKKSEKMVSTHDN